MSLSFKTITCVASIVMLLPFSACKKQQVQIYEVPKEVRADRVVDTDEVSPEAAPEPGQLDWDVPEDWQVLPPTGFRKGNYLFVSESGAQVEITVSSFPGQVGGLLANVNRWLGQASLEPISPAELEEVARTSAVEGETVTTVDLKDDSGAEDSTRIYASIVEHDGQSWFFKMSGPDAAVEEQIPAFDQMVQTLRFETPAAAEPAKAPAATELIFDTPEGWVESEGNSLRIASYSISKDGLPSADFAITSFPGDTGGTVANVNRWRSQIGLPPWTAAEVEENQETRQSDHGYTFQLFDLQANQRQMGEEDSDRILAAILFHNGRSWFFKLRGDALLLDTQRAKFASLLQSVRFDQAKSSDDEKTSSER